MEIIQNIDRMSVNFLNNQPKSIKKIFGLIRREGPLTSAEIEDKSQYSDRTVRVALRKLLTLGFIKKSINWEDMRTALFHLPKSTS